mmetsp:Transcript_573/g.1014  ORF Transcript_573/g.1014 Transcript_573/m.1014 type:complete len:108 (+) Transcript_573:66-389(+)
MSQTTSTREEGQGQGKMSYYFRKFFPNSEYIAEDCVQSIEHQRDLRYKYQDFQTNATTHLKYNFFQKPQYQSMVRYKLQLIELRPLSDYERVYNKMAKNQPLLPAMD